MSGRKLTRLSPTASIVNPLIRSPNMSFLSRLAYKLMSRFGFLDETLEAYYL